MSTDYGYYCRDCNIESDTWLNHGDRVLRDIFIIWPDVKALEQKGAHLTLSVHIEDVYQHDAQEIFAFLRAHDGHRLMLCDEYGGRFHFWQPVREAPKKPEE